MTYKLHFIGPDSCELRRYRKTSGRVPVSEWLVGLSMAISSRVQAYMDRMKQGHFGHSRTVGEGVMELKMNFGAGYRIYYLRDGQAIVVLLCGGDKGTQARDIHLAHAYAADYWSRR